MASTLNKFIRARYQLQVAYEKGLCAYPRVANNYITDIRFFEHPHPTVAPFDEYAQSLKYSEYPFVKELSALELTNRSIATPATLMSNLETVDTYFDGKLQPRITKIREIEDKLDGFYDHLEDLYSQFGDSVFDKQGKIDVNRLSKDGIVSQFRMDITPFKIKLAPSPEREKAKNEEKKSKVRDDIDNLPPIIDEKKIVVNNIDEALALLKKKRLLMKRLEEKRELQYKSIAKTNSI